MRAKRKFIDCRTFPNEIGCTLTISGNEKEVLKVAIRHAVEEHGHKDTSELRKQLRKLLKEEHSKQKTKMFNKLNPQTAGKEIKQ